MTPVVTASALEALEERRARLPREVVAELDRLDDADVARLCWLMEARVEQLPPPDDEWLVWLILSGRGWGKTRVGAEDTADYMLTHPGCRVAIVAPTFAAGKNVCVEGESGLLAVLPDSVVQKWNRSEGLLLLTNGSQAQVYSSEEPERLRGPQHHRAWCDELAAWRYLQDTWDMLLFGLRLPWGDESPRTIVTTTPKPYKLLRDLKARTTTRVVTGSTFDNKDNLSRATLEELDRRYSGTTLGRQELEGEILEDAEGAMWTRGLVEKTRLPFEVLEELDLATALTVGIAVDPAVTAGDASDETGIVVYVLVDDCPCGEATPESPHVLFVEDCSGTLPVSGPDGWPARVVERHDAYCADEVCAEANNGGDLVEEVLRSAAKDRPGDALPLSYKKVLASRGKRPRAEPVVGLFEQGRAHIVGALPELEDQMCTWDGSGKSPDRMDALVWGATRALLQRRGRRGGLRYGD